MCCFKRKYIDWQIRKANVARKKRFPDMMSAHSVCVLFESKYVSDEVFAELNGLLKHKFKSVRYIVLRKKKDMQEYLSCVSAFSRKEVFWGKPSQSVVDNFLSQKDDLLIDLTLKESLPLKYLAGISGAECKCGLTKDDYALYDFEIRNLQSDSTIDLLKNMLKYLEMIKTK
ncbi:MAG: hypothetical protein E7076_08590 [Bacteroidales bacterium]|nr:hypothetical protein [Bacteroidales bacterium]MBR6310580.1 hypothetical protein [Paludibacteraceae bacterium]